MVWGLWSWSLGLGVLAYSGAAGSESEAGRADCTHHCDIAENAELFVRCMSELGLANEVRALVTVAVLCLVQGFMVQHVANVGPRELPPC